MKIFYSLILLFFVSTVFSQSFITMDEDTYEFITDVNYTAFKNNKPVYQGVTLTDEITVIKADFDSVSFSRLDYKTTGLRKDEMDSIVLLKKSTIYLDEIVLSNSSMGKIVLGEKNRFVKSQARPFSKDFIDGIIFRNEQDADLRVDKVSIFVNKVKFTTAYKLNFYTIQESFAFQGNQEIKNEKLLFSTDVLQLKPGTKGEVEIDILPGYIISKGNKVLVSVQLIDYFNTDGSHFEPEDNKVTKLKFQLSNRADYYAKLININTRKETLHMRNINLMMNYDFANHFHKKPHKSIIVAPSILLYSIKQE